MKIKEPQIIFLGFGILLFLSTFSFGQEKKNNLLVNIQLNHYLAEDNGHFISFNPGFEFLYQFILNENWALASGIDYTVSRWKDDLEFGMSQWRRTGQEIFIPICLQRRLGRKTILSFGAYPGWLLKGKEENLNKFSNGEWIDQTENLNYSESQKFTCDLYLDFKYKLDAGPKFSIYLGPFFKCKLTDNWMKQRRNPFSFGVNMGFGI